MSSPDLETPEGFYWYVAVKDSDVVTLVVQLHKRVEGVGENGLEWSWPLAPRDLAKQERIEARIRACKRALLQKHAENKRIEAAIHASV